jgi:CheY-like chemotaxis protein
MDTPFRQIANSLSQAAKTGEIRQLGGMRVLWVDDEPQNNEHGIKALQSQGVEVITSRTTADALTKAKEGRFDAIVTDQLRFEDGVKKDTAGCELIRQLRGIGVEVPVILSTAFPNRAEAQSAGFYDVTNTQHGVFELVMKAMSSR